jgi:predicted alpha/beta-hydrolase family hydrolase
MDKSSWLMDGPARAKTTFLFAHGAGAAMDTEFMQTIAEAIAENGIRVIRFEFPYMHAQRVSGKKRPPDREPILRETWLNLIRSV